MEEADLKNKDNNISDNNNNNIQEDSSLVMQLIEENKNESVVGVDDSDNSSPPIATPPKHFSTSPSSSPPSTAISMPTVTTSKPFPPPPPPPPPPSMMLFDKTTGTFHPDFMFCGACATCNEDESPQNKEIMIKLEDFQKNNIGGNSYDSGDDDIGNDNDDGDNDDDGYDGDNNNNNNNKAHAIIYSKFVLDGPIQSPSHALVIQSLLMPLPGVSKVTVKHGQDFLEVAHDAQTSTESIVHALQSAGHPATLQASHLPPQGNEPLWVRSTFFVKGICCASEVPSIRRIVKPLHGVAKLQINITTKLVYVQHDLEIINAQQIADELSKEGFPAKINKDGATTAAAQQKSLHHARTTLHANRSLVEQDIAIIQQLISQIKGVSKIGVNINESAIYVDHDIRKVTSAQCVEQLLPQYQCEVIEKAEEVAETLLSSPLDQIGHSTFVESTLLVEDLDNDTFGIIEDSIAQNFGTHQVRAVFSNMVSQTIKVEHDPELATTANVCDILSRYHVICKVTVDGEQSKLYLPLQNDDSQMANTKNNYAANNEAGIGSIRANVILSGVFWFASILSIRGGSWDDLKYFGLLSVLFGLPPIVVKAIRTIRRCQFDANCMMVVAALGAVALQEYDEAASVSFLFAVSELLEARATFKARKALSAIISLRPDRANVIHPITKEIVIVPADCVPLGSLVSVKTGDKIAADGIVVEGSSVVDESSLTGESQPAHKQVNDTVSGGTINIGNTQLVIKTTTTAEDSAVSRLIRLVEEAQSNRSPTEKLIDKFARTYTPAVVFVAGIMCTIPWFWGAEIGRYWTLNGLIIIVIACPCALTISTPVTYAAGLAATAQRGIIVKGGAKLEAVGSVDKIIFDKTGTLTCGRFSVIALEVIGTSTSRTEMLSLLASIEGPSSHPLSSTLVTAARSEGALITSNKTVTDHTILKGEGVTAKIDNKTVYVGNTRLFERLGMYGSLPMHSKDLVKSWDATGGTVGFLGTEESGIIGAFCVKDEVRAEAKAVIEGLNEKGIYTVMCTGDSNSAAHAVAHEIGIPPEGVHSQLLPEDKLHFVGSLVRPQSKYFNMCRGNGYVLFCGDGVNDAPALAVADLGVSMGEGAAMAMEMSDITLMDSNLTKLLYTITMGRRVIRTIIENITLSLFAKIVVVGLTLVGKMTLFAAIAADVGIMLVVTVNGMKLLPRQWDPNNNLQENPTNKQRRGHRVKYSKVDTGTVELTQRIGADMV